MELLRMKEDRVRKIVEDIVSNKFKEYEKNQTNYPVEIEDSYLYKNINKTGKLNLTYLFKDIKVSQENYFFNGIKKPVIKIES